MSRATPTRRQPTQERSRRTVAKILDAAEAIVVADGVEAATTRAIADRAGVSVPSLYRFFADREAILDTMLEQLVANVDDEARAAEQEAAPEVEGIGDLVGLELELTARYFERHPALASLWFTGRASAAVVEFVRRRNADLATRVHEIAIARGFVRADTPVKAFELAVEFADRTLEVAFRGEGSERSDPEAIQLGHAAITGFLERWAVRRR